MKTFTEEEPRQKKIFRDEKTRLEARKPGQEQGNLG